MTFLAIGYRTSEYTVIIIIRSQSQHITEINGTPYISQFYCFMLFEASEKQHCVSLNSVHFLKVFLRTVRAKDIHTLGEREDASKHMHRERELFVCVCVATHTILV